jgi:hypothetical protein
MCAEHHIKRLFKTCHPRLGYFWNRVGPDASLRICEEKFVVLKPYQQVQVCVPGSRLIVGKYHLALTLKKMRRYWNSGHMIRQL